MEPAHGGDAVVGAVRGFGVETMFTLSGAHFNGSRVLADDAVVIGDGGDLVPLMDADTLFRHGLPVVMIVCNNGIWGLEKHPMRGLYGYDAAADLRPHRRYDEVVRALDGAGGQVTRPDGIGPAPRRALDSGVPYLVSASTGPADAYPRSTTGV
ncbi:thiamine pyrophosphate-dependent enzyme [Spirillospora sp. NPDC127200]